MMNTMNSLNSESAEPLYRQLADKLKKEMDDGIFLAGSKLPTENELVETYKVSRVTVRKALDSLTQQGYLERRSGKGTFVAEKKIQRELSGVIGFTEMCRMMGCVAGSKVIKLSKEYPSEQDAQQLRISEDSQIVVIERVRSADGEPVVIEHCKFPEDFLFLMQENLADASLYDLIQRKKNIHFSKSVKTLDIVYATSQEGRFLGVAKGYPLLRIESVVEDSTGIFRHLSKQLCIGDKFKLMV